MSEGTEHVGHSPLPWVYKEEPDGYWIYDSEGRVVTDCYSAYGHKIAAANARFIVASVTECKALRDLVRRMIPALKAAVRMSSYPCKDAEQDKARIWCHEQYNQLLADARAMLGEEAGHVQD